MPGEVFSSIQVFNSHFVDNIKDLYTDKADKKSCPIVHAYNNKKKNLMLMHLSKILGVRQDISSCFASIIWKNDNDNVKFFLWDITQTYIKVALNLNLDIYIWPLFKLILQVNASFDSIIKVIRPI